MWDIDDVLNDLMGEWFAQDWLPRHSTGGIPYHGLSSNPPHEVLGIARTEYLASLDQFRRTRYAEMAPVAEAMEWFERNGARYRHEALSEVPLAYAHVSADWLLRHFGKWIRSFHFVPSKRDGEIIPAYERSKAEFLGYCGREAILVDDRRENVEAARSLGHLAVLMPRPWNGAPGSVAETFRELERL